MNRRGFVGATLVAVSGFLFPQKLKACPAGISHKEMTRLILSCNVVTTHRFSAYGSIGVSRHLESGVIPQISDDVITFGEYCSVDLREDRLRCLTLYWSAHTIEYYKENDSWIWAREIDRGL